MAHELDKKANGEAAMMYIGEVPWHGLGTKLDGPATAEEAITTAGLDWEVDIQQAYYYPILASSPHPAPHRQFIVRRDTNTVLGQCRDRYIPIQNREAFGFFDSIIGEGKAIYHTAGSLRSGERIWVLAKLPETIVVRGDDVVDQYLLLTNSHSGAETTRIRFTPIRVVCNNTLSAALHRKGIEARVHHTGNLENQWKRTSDILGIAQQVFSQTADVYRAMAARSVTNGELVGYYETLLPDIKGRLNTRRKRIRGEWQGLFEGGIGRRLAGSTAWGAYNSVTEWVDHCRSPRSNNDRRLWSNWFAGGADLRQRAYAGALVLVNN